MSKLTDYIEKELKKGFSSEKIKETLVKYKYPEDEIEEALIEVKQHEFPQHRWKKPLLWEMTGVISGLILIIILLVYPFGNGEKITEKIEIVAEKQLTVPECDGLSVGERDVCVLRLAKQQNETQICVVMSDVSRKIDCYQRIWEKDECRYLDIVGEDADECYAGKAVNENDENVCFSAKNITRCMNALLDKAGIDVVCKDSNCKQQIEFFTKPPICDTPLCKLSSTNNNAGLDKLIVEYKNKETTKIGNILKSDEELYEIALKNKNINMCKYLEDNSLKLKCMEKLK
ncbi:hypothetical protein HZA96_02905 [Candidatus Woesearchaeota archaeon]|nr:hypothetical protein [Candidatus Woesearchaeota archaeon]